MNSWEALEEAITNGRKVRKRDWDPNYYVIFHLGSREWHNQRGIRMNNDHIPGHTDPDDLDSWELYEEPKTAAEHKWVDMVSREEFEEFKKQVASAMIQVIIECADSTYGARIATKRVQDILKVEVDE